MIRFEPSSAGPRIVTGVEGVLDLVGTTLGTSPWIEIDQPTINAFADATGDHHWSHIDPKRSAASPLGSTIAHGLLVLSLHPSCLYAMVEFQGFRGLFNYGYDKVRFPASVRVGSRVRVAVTVLDAKATDDGAQATFRFEFESDAGDTPVCIADYRQHFRV